MLDILSVNDKDFSISIMAFLGIQWAEPRMFKEKRKNSNGKKKNNKKKGNEDEDQEEFVLEPEVRALNTRARNGSRMVPVDPQFIEKVPDA